MASIEPPFSVVGKWSEPWESQAFKRWALRLRRELLPREVTMGLVFVSPILADQTEEIVDILRNALGIPTLGGCVSSGAIVDDSEYESFEGMTLALYHLPGARIQELAFTAEMVKDGLRDSSEGFWRRRFEPGAEGITSWLAFAEPLSFGVEDWINSWQKDFPGVPVYGGLSFFQPPNDVGAVICNDQIIGSGGAIFGFGGGIKIHGLVAQGCTPVGESWTVTKAQENVLERIGNRPAVQILEETIEGMSDELRTRSQGVVFVGIAVDEYQDDFGRGDFLVRNLLSVDRSKGHLVVGAYPRVGQTMQFQIRDSESASEEIKDLVARAKKELEGKRVFGACMSNCLGRGMSLFETPHHDAILMKRLVGEQAAAGFFGNGEFGPVGKSNFVHGYTSSIAVFTEV